MKPGATIFYQAGWLWNIPKIIKMIESNGMIINKMVMINAFKHNRQPIIFVAQKHPNPRMKQQREKARKNEK